MAIAFDAKTGFEYSAATSGSGSHTCTGSNRGLLAYSYAGNTGASGATVTYGGVAMTYVGESNQGNGERVAVWKLAAPASGSNTFAWSGYPSGGTRWTLVSYTGVNQSDIVHNSNFPAQSADPITPSVTSSISGCWAVVGLVYATGFSSFSTGTLRNGAATNQTVVGDSNATFTTSYSFNIDMTSSGQTGSAVIALAPSGDVTMTVSQGSFALTLQNVTFSTILGTLVVAVGTFALTIFNAALRFTGWTNQSKNSSSFTNQSKNSSSWINQNKN